VPEADDTIRDGALTRPSLHATRTPKALW
jgi:hypothetical protein